MNRPIDTDLVTLLGYLHGELPPDETARLETRLMRDDALVRQLAQLAVEESILSEWAAGVERIRQVDEADRALRSRRTSPSVHGRAAAAAPASARRRKAGATPMKIRTPQRNFLAAAAAILLVAAGAALWINRADNLPGGAPIARVRALRGAVWAPGQPEIRVGIGVPAGCKLELLRGSVEIDYANGAQVTIEGPSAYEFNALKIATLSRGKLTAHVPPGAVDFTVHTPAIEVIDKGTRFGVRVGAEGAEVHVFEGAVETRSPAKGNKAAVTQPLSMLQAVKFDAGGKLTEWVAPDYAGFGAQKLAPGVVSTSRHVVWLPKIPPSFEEGKISSDEKIFLILERRDVVLQYEVPITFLGSETSGTRSGYSHNVRLLPAGTKVDSYLLHRDPQRGKNFLDGSVTFDRPIVAIIARGKQLAGSDKVFGAPGTAYEIRNLDARGLENAASGSAPDVLSFSQGTNTVGVRFEVNPEDTLDEIRILVATEK